MTTVLVTDRRNPGCVLAKRSRARTRLATHLAACRLDRALAAGDSPDSSAALSERARELIGARARRRLARSIRRTIDDAQRSSNPFSSSIPVCRRKVLASRRTLEELSDRLAAGGPLDARGVAQIQLLFTDGGGPLYYRPAADDLEPALERAMAALGWSRSAP